MQVAVSRSLRTLSRGSFPLSTKSMTLPGVPTTISAPAGPAAHKLCSLYFIDPVEGTFSQPVTSAVTLCYCTMAPAQWLLSLYSVMLTCTSSQQT